MSSAICSRSCTTFVSVFCCSLFFFLFFSFFTYDWSNLLFAILFWQLLQLFTSLQLFGHVQVFLAITVGQTVQPTEIEIHEKKKFQTTQNKVAKMQKIALTRTRSHMISHYKNSLKHLLLTWTTATKFLQQWNWMHHSTLLVEVWSEKLICTLKL